MKIDIEVDEKTLRELVTEHVQRQLGDIHFSQSDVVIQVKSKQNYKSEWETAAFRATLHIDTQVC